MSIKRYYADKDSTISNALKANLTTRATGSNMGDADILEVFSIYGQSTTSSVELSRVLLEFPVEGTDVGEIKGDRQAGTIPASGSVSFYLKLYNAKHSQTLPVEPKFNIAALSQSWSEGTGLDMEEYKHEGTCNWLERTEATAWDEPGGLFHTAAYSAGNNLPLYDTTLTNGHDDIEVEITSMVEEWIAGTKPNYGLAVYFTASQEAYNSNSSGLNNYTSTGLLHNLEGPRESYYTKKFFGRGSEFFFKRPIIEARWDSSLKDDRGNFYYSSSLADGPSNLNTLYLYNYVRGELQNIPALAADNYIYVQIFSGSDDNTAPTGSAVNLCPVKQGSLWTTAENNLTYVTGGLHETGIYTASVCLTSSPTPLTKIFDVWQTANGLQLHTGSVLPNSLALNSDYPIPKYYSNISNLKPSYDSSEKARFRLYTRDENWNPTIYTVAKSAAESNVVESAYYKVFRVVDNLEVIPYGTGSDNHTKLSHDISGNYFDLDMSMLDSDYMYGIKFVYKINSEYKEQPEIFKFRVD
tara:strand:- start:2902 stop:4476 length:1575 start_codon:yes stop_codon:yes gene_type:complete